jgi:hypothetical protein
MCSCSPLFYQGCERPRNRIISRFGQVAFLTHIVFLLLKLVQNSAAVSTRSVGLPKEAKEEMKTAQGHVPRNRFGHPSPNRMQPTTCLAESGQMADGTNQRNNATSSCSSVVEDDSGRDGEDSKPSLVTSSVLTGSAASRDVVQEEAATSGEIPSGWTRVKLEPDC